MKYLAVTLLCLWVAWLNNYDMGSCCPSGSRIGSTEVGVHGHAGSNPAQLPAMTRKQALQWVYLYGQNNE